MWNTHRSKGDEHSRFLFSKGHLASPTQKEKDIKNEEKKIKQKQGFCLDIPIAVKESNMKISQEIKDMKGTRLMGDHIIRG